MTQKSDNSYREQTKYKTIKKKPFEEMTRFIIVIIISFLLYLIMDVLFSLLILIYFSLFLISFIIVAI